MIGDAIPVLYYHSVATHSESHPWSFLSVDITTFKSQMSYLKKRGFTTCDWSELYDHIHGFRRLPKKTVFIHFDDGFLDNWTVVYPIMEKYNFKYSILITPDFVEKSDIIRPFVNQTTSKNKENWWGYLSEGEIKKMSNSNLVDFQCHGYSHTWFESSNEVIDFYDGTQFYPHLNWNRNTQLKPYWLTKFNDMLVEKGTPVFNYKKTLELSRVFLPNKAFISECIKTTQNLGFSAKKLNEIYEKYKSEDNLGNYESENEAHNRVKKELLATKEYIENLTQKDASYLVFPGGGINPEIIERLKKYGFKLISKGTVANNFNSNIFQISRAAGFHNFKTNFFLNQYLNVLLIELQIKRGAGNRYVNFVINKLK